MTYRETIRAIASREAGKMRGQAVKSSAKILILAGLLGGFVAVRQRKALT